MTNIDIILPIENNDHDDHSHNENELMIDFDIVELKPATLDYFPQL